MKNLPRLTLQQIEKPLDRLQLPIDRHETLGRDDRERRLISEEVEELAIERGEALLVREERVNRQDAHEPIPEDERRAADRSLLLARRARVGLGENGPAAPDGFPLDRVRQSRH